jgi:hypothetical protein
MKKKMLTLLVIAGMTAGSASAQLQLPQPSPNASVKHTVGLTDITIEYASPAAKGRAIFGGLVPYGEMWRTGANAATTIEFSKDVSIKGNKVPKGKYSLLTIPAQNEFTVILNKDVSASVSSYKKEDDQVRFTVAPKACEHRERMTFMFTNFTDTQATIDLEWEKTRVSFQVDLETDTQALSNIDRELGRSWRTYNAAARYHLDNKKELETGMKYVDISIGLKDEWFNNWTKAQLYSAMNRQADAYKFALKAKEIGDKNPAGFWYKDLVEKAIADWKPAAGTKGKK